jgi:Flp pilus assembly protein TadD
MLLGAGSMPAASSQDEVQFGINAARRGLWNEALNNLAISLEQQGAFERAREAYEKALKLKPDSVYIQQNFDLFREADDKRNRKSKRKG